MCSAIWMYDVKSGRSSIIYSQKDGGAIGRVDWIDDNEICFVSYYDFQGSRDNINYYNAFTKENKTIFPYTDENYNNVTLLPIGNRKITFMTSKKNDIYQNSKTILLDIDSNDFIELGVKLNDEDVLLIKFIFSKLNVETLK